MSKYIPTIAEQVIDMAYEKVDDLLMELFEQHKRVLEAGRLTFATGDWDCAESVEQEERRTYSIETEIEKLGYFGHSEWATL
jgi:hypothetical protein